MSGGKETRPSLPGEPASEGKPYILIGSPIRQRPDILANFLLSLSRLDQSSFTAGYHFIDENDESESSALLAEFAERHPGTRIERAAASADYVRNETTHYWNEELVWKVAAFKDVIIRQALETRADGLFLVDSDLLLHPPTVEQLLAANVDIVSEIFWTRWRPQSAPQPQVWLRDEYTQWEQRRGESLDDAQIAQRYAEFTAMLRKPGLYPVGGLGACTLIARTALERGVSFQPIPNLSFWGEDRHFCIRAAALGLSLYVDTHYPAYHIYRDSDLAGAGDFLAGTGPPLAGSAAPDPSTAPLETSSRESREPVKDWADIDGAAKSGAEVNSLGEEQGSSGANAAAGKRPDDLQEPEHDNISPPSPAQPCQGTCASSAYAPRLGKPPLPVTLSMVVRNEAGRYLERVLLAHRAYIHQAVIIDDASTDDTADVIMDALRGIPVRLVRNRASRFGNEVELRKQQWKETALARPEWILNLDADELPEERFAEALPELLDQPDVDLYCFRLYDFWNETHYREDTYWQAHRVYRPFLLRYRASFAYRWKETPQHCGRFPENALDLPHRLSSLRIKHLGWADAKHRLEKWRRYKSLDPDGAYGWPEQYASILDERPHLVEWVE